MTKFCVIALCDVEHRVLGDIARHRAETTTAITRNITQLQNWDGSKRPKDHNSFLDHEANAFAFLYYPQYIYIYIYIYIQIDR